MAKRKVTNPKIQFVWWGFDENWLKRWGIWEYPGKDSPAREIMTKPFFYGLCLGILEIRFWTWEDKDIKNAKT